VTRRREGVIDHGDGIDGASPLPPVNFLHRPKMSARHYCVRLPFLALATSGTSVSDARILVNSRVTGSYGSRMPGPSLNVQSRYPTQLSAVVHQAPLGGVTIQPQPQPVKTMAVVSPVCDNV
jgi:hypothetical protein